MIEYLIRYTIMLDIVRSISHKMDYNATKRSYYFRYRTSLGFMNR